MLIDPTLSLTEIEAEIVIIKSKLSDRAEMGDMILSGGAEVEYNNAYNYYKEQLEQLYSMKTQKKNRGE